ncbi:hypothetical protein [Hymenobacter lapidiphilus]|uniref:hypothetical protein n=1 Tax=Hymenobacter sp. CCM 8763 TaxID=2303334 RepID=UPI0011C1196C|nr:hypothetical protein [Hymenobacter sp. CCM 8763]
MTLVAILVVVLGVGVLLVLGIGYGVWSAGSKIILPIRKLFGYQPPPEPPPIPEVPVVLFQNEQLRLLITEQESGAVSREFERWFEAWDDLEDQGHFPGLYRLHTAPEIPGLHGQLVSDLCREWPAGLFLQLVEPHPGQEPAGTTWLIYLELATLRWHQVVETNDYYLHPDAVGLEHGAFEGLNPAGNKLELRVQTDA